MANDVIVAKFGGTSVADAGQIEKVRKIIESDARRKIIVVSAPGKRFPKDQKITDLLLLCHQHIEQGIPFDDVFHLITRRYSEIIEVLGIQKIVFEDLLTEIKMLAPQQTRPDFLASRGEQLLAFLLAMYLGYKYIDAGEIIFFNERGKLNLEKSKDAIREKLSACENAVIPGFYGTAYDGSIKIFPRGGSDITGSIVALGADAILYENWTDVPGFLMADPEIVESPKPIRKISYRELRELSYMGAEVFHNEAIFPARVGKIPIHIKNTNSPNDEGTIITPDEKDWKGSCVISGIAGRKDFTVIAMEKDLMNQEKGFGRKLLSIIEAHNVSYEHTPSGMDSISLIIANSELEDTQETKNKLEKILSEIREKCAPDSLEGYPLAQIATVGRGMAHTPGIAAKLFSALAEDGVNVRVINQGSSEINIIVGVEIADFEKAIRAIYRAFCS